METGVEIVPGACDEAGTSEAGLMQWMKNIRFVCPCCSIEFSPHRISPRIIGPGVDRITLHALNRAKKVCYDRIFPLHVFQCQ